MTVLLSHSECEFRFHWNPNLFAYNLEIVISISRNGLLKACARFVIERSEIRNKQHDCKSVHFECKMVLFYMIWEKSRLKSTLVDYFSIECRKRLFPSSIQKPIYCKINQLVFLARPSFGCSRFDFVTHLENVMELLQCFQLGPV